MAHQLSQDVAKMTLSDRVTEKQLNNLAAKLGADWENLAIFLGLTKAEVFRCKAQHTHSVWSQIFAMLVMWKAKAGTGATVTNLVKKLREFGIDEDTSKILLPPKQSETGLVPAVEPESTARTSLDPRLTLLLKEASVIVQKTHPGVDFTPDPSGGRKEEDRVLKLKEWEAPLKKRVENFSSSINYSIDYEGFSAINDSMKSVCLIEHPNGCGSGFLIGPRHVITANHVWAEANKSCGQVTDPQRFLVHFNITGAKRLTFTFKPDISVVCDDTLDYAIVEICHTDDRAVSQTMQTESVRPLGTKIAAGVGNEDIVVIVGHPDGGRKRVDFCAVVGVDDVTSKALTLLGPPDKPQKWPTERPNMESYQTSVMFEGSSGSPAFSKHGNAVLLHTCGFRPYSNQLSIVEMGVLLSSVKQNARLKLSSDVDVFSEIFGS
ncbi:uncharacterized protein [Branchiostoma lanceolatum]|uniref:uncharacterized protein n=1 Tax=Branchiostoma lanceolatum TaxID=7740 RepID=UPI0034515848